MTVPKHLKHRVFEFHRGLHRLANTTNDLYPFNVMEPGDWFDVASYQADLPSVQDAARKWAKRHGTRVTCSTRGLQGGHQAVRVTVAPIATQIVVAPTRTLSIERELAAALDAIPLGETHEFKADADCEPARITPVKILRAVRHAQDTSTARFATKRRGSLVVEITRRA